MKVHICEENASLIKDILAEVNGRGYQHCYTNVDELLYIISRAKLSLPLKALPPSAWKGVCITSTSGDSVPNSYRGKRVATTVTIVRGAKDWFLTGAARTEIWQQGGGRDHLTLTPEQDAKIVSNIRSNYAIAA